MCFINDVLCIQFVSITYLFNFFFSGSRSMAMKLKAEKYQKQVQNQVTQAASI